MFTSIISFLFLASARAEIAYDGYPAPVVASRTVLGWGRHDLVHGARRAGDEWRALTKLETSLKVVEKFDRLLATNRKLTPTQIFRADEHRWLGERYCEKHLSALIVTVGTTPELSPHELAAFELVFISADGKRAGEYRVERDQIEVRQYDERTIRLVVVSKRREEILGDLRARMVRVDRLGLRITAIGPGANPFRSPSLDLDRRATRRFFHDQRFWAGWGVIWPWDRPQKFRNLK